MRKVILFIAMSLDGYIADKRGQVDWLRGQDENADNLNTYSVFVKDIDTVIMGWNTYHQIVTELSPDQWIYEDLKTYVITHRQIASTEKIIFTQENPCDLVKNLQKEKGKDIWICGGANVIHPLIETRMIDLYHISVIPVILGDGIRLFPPMEGDILLRLKRSQTYNGIMDLVYEKR